MAYNLTGIANNSTMLGFVQGVNDTLMLGWFGTFFLIGVCIIIYMAFVAATNDTNRSIAATSFLAFGLALILRAISLVGDLTLYITLVMSAAAIAFTWKKG